MTALGRRLGRGLLANPLGVNCGAIGLSQGTETPFLMA